MIFVIWCFDIVNEVQGTINDWIRCNKSLSYEKNIGSSVLYHKNLTNKSYQVLVYR